MVCGLLAIMWISGCASFCFSTLQTTCGGGGGCIVDYDRTGFLSDRGIRKRIALEEKKKKEQDEIEGKNDEGPHEEQVKKEEQESKVLVGRMKGEWKCINKTDFRKKDVYVKSFTSLQNLFMLCM